MESEPHRLVPRGRESGAGAPLFLVFSLDQSGAHGPGESFDYRAVGLFPTKPHPQLRASFLAALVQVVHFYFRVLSSRARAGDARMGRCQSRVCPMGELRCSNRNF